MIIGANGSGKTSLLDVFSLLAASSSGKLNDAMGDLGGIGDNLTNLTAANGNKAKLLSFALAMEIPGHHAFEYRLAMAPSGVGYEITNENLVQQKNTPQPFKHIEAHHGDVRYFEQQDLKKRAVRPNWDYNANEVGALAGSEDVSRTGGLSQAFGIFDALSRSRRESACSDSFATTNEGRQVAGA